MSREEVSGMAKHEPEPGKFCAWADKNEANRRYHDTEWGVPTHEDQPMFEHLMLECLQCGLSWDLILQKRDIIRRCFDGFDIDKIAGYGEADVERIVNTEGMIRSPRKVRAVINNARRSQELRKEIGSFSAYFWAFTGGTTLIYKDHGTRVPASNSLSERISKDLKKRGFQYVGPITVYSHLQACGIINDHDWSCPRFQSSVGLNPVALLTADQ